MAGLSVVVVLVAICVTWLIIKVVILSMMTVLVLTVFKLNLWFVDVSKLDINVLLGSNELLDMVVVVSELLSIKEEDVFKMALLLKNCES